MEKDLGTAAIAVGRYQVAWALGCRSFYLVVGHTYNDEIILTRNDAGVFMLAAIAFLQRDAGNITRQNSMPSCYCLWLGSGNPTTLRQNRDAMRTSDISNCSFLLLVRPDLLFAGEKLLECRVLPDWVPYWIDLQLLNGNVKTYRHREQAAQCFNGFACFARARLNFSQTSQIGWT